MFGILQVLIQQDQILKESMHTAGFPLMMLILWMFFTPSQELWASALVSNSQLAMWTYTRMEVASNLAATYKEPSRAWHLMDCLVGIISVMLENLFLSISSKGALFVFCGFVWILSLYSIPFFHSNERRHQVWAGEISPSVYWLNYK